MNGASKKREDKKKNIHEVHEEEVLRAREILSKMSRE